MPYHTISFPKVVSLSSYNVPPRREVTVSAKRSIQDSGAAVRPTDGRGPTLAVPEPARVKRYHVQLSSDDRQHLEQTVSRGKTSARVTTRARTLLKAADGANDSHIVEALGTSRATVERTRRRFATAGFDAAVKDKPQKGRPRALSSKQAAHLIAIACSDTPGGHDHWPLRLSGQKMVELGYVKSISPETVRQVLEKNELKPWRHEEWCLPRVGGAFVAAMEDVLDLYAEPYDPLRPVVCLDEKSVRLHADVSPPLPVRPGTSARSDYEYVRCGTANLFVCVEPLRGYRLAVLIGFHGRPEAGHYITGMRAARIILAMEPEYVVRTTTRRHDECSLGLKTTF